MSVDTEGRLFFFNAVPQKSSEPQNKETFHWTTLFREAGLDITQFTVSTPQEIPLQVYDEQMSWTGKYPEAPYPIRVEAAAFQGRPVYFEIFGTLANFSIPIRSRSAHERESCLASTFECCSMAPWSSALYWLSKIYVLEEETEKVLFVSHFFFWFSRWSDGFSQCITFLSSLVKQSCY